MARAEELVLGGVPRHDTTQMRADGVDTVGGEGLVGLHHKVGRVTLQQDMISATSFRMIIYVQNHLNRLCPANTP